MLQISIDTKIKIDISFLVARGAKVAEIIPFELGQDNSCERK